MRRSHFTLLLALAVIIVVGAALVPRIDVADQPRPRQGKTLGVWFSWPGASAKVVEQNVTSRIEGLVSMVSGVKEVSSESNFGSGSVRINLKPDANVSATKFEIASLLRQTYRQLPEGVSYPELSGGEVVNESRSKNPTQLLQTYQVHSNLTDEQLREYINTHVKPQLQQMQQVKQVEVTGGTNKYIVITYDPMVLAGYGLSAGNLQSGIESFLGRHDVVGEMQQPGDNERHTIYLATERFDKPLEQMPIGMVAGKMVYLNDLATYEYKDMEPDRYFRVNGLNTIYMNIYVEADDNFIACAKEVNKRMEQIVPELKSGVYLEKIYDASQQKADELHKLVWRSLLSLFILLAFVWLVRRDWRYLLVMVITLVANVMMAVIAYYLFDIRLHIYSLAGITVSLGMVIDAAVVMVDHYSYYHNRKAFMAILAALLTTIGALVIVLWLPDFLKDNLYDFAWIIIINLTVALLVAYLFVPALIERMGYHSRQQGEVRNMRLASAWSHWYVRYIAFAQRHRWGILVAVILLFGLPIDRLPQYLGKLPGSEWNINGDNRPWYETAYNKVIGSQSYQRNIKPWLSLCLGGTLRPFSHSLSYSTYARQEDKEKILTINAQMPLGGTAAQLNEKVVMLENYLTRFPEIERFETRVERSGAVIVVRFRKEVLDTGFPYELENRVIGKAITIGGADWSTSGVSERGYSNSLWLTQRLNRIEVVGN